MKKLTQDYKVLFSKARRKNGSVCAKYIQISPRRGLKVFDEKEDRDRTYELQRIASKHNLAPNIYDKIDHKNKYGYITEHVKIVSDTNYSYKGFIKKAKILVEDLRKKIKFDFFDDHEHNIGIKNKKYICIDFGEY